MYHRNQKNDNFRISQKYKCGKCFNVIDTAELDALVDVPTEESSMIMGEHNIRPSIPEKPYATCPYCGNLLFVKTIREVKV